MNMLRHLWLVIFLPFLLHQSTASGPPMGMHFRLRADFPVAEYSAPVQVILRAMQR